MRARDSRPSSAPTATTGSAGSVEAPTRRNKDDVTGRDGRCDGSSRTRIGVCGVRADENTPARSGGHNPAIYDDHHAAPRTDHHHHDGCATSDHDDSHTGHYFDSANANHDDHHAAPRTDGRKYWGLINGAQRDRGDTQGDNAGQGGEWHGVCPGRVRKCGSTVSRCDVHWAWDLQGHGSGDGSGDDLRRSDCEWHHGNHKNDRTAMKGVTNCASKSDTPAYFIPVCVGQRRETRVPRLSVGWTLARQRPAHTQALPTSQPDPASLCGRHWEKREQLERA